ncbi:uncharacterized protein N7483_007180 [Penicillium malachiteum]|uniref:uncharacterized protein n=1 Tax=Penicillium malachiteum TaxID=1324776 RepID=UPI002549749F|nr:uncharacterized protein N7483_007180 [Penicillium malachiteum]KAJ5725823.1 hypothetical protein N7483_007180 [Penicillium malachiteum]
MTRKRSEVVAGCRGCRRFDRDERTIKLQGVVADFRTRPNLDLSDRMSRFPARIILCPITEIPGCTLIM